MGNLHRVVASEAIALDLQFAGLTATINLPVSDFFARYFCKVVPEIALFSKVCNRSL